MDSVQWIPLDFDGVHWTPVESSGFQWTQSSGVQWIPLDFGGVHWIPLESVGMRKVLLFSSNHHGKSQVVTSAGSRRLQLNLPPISSKQRASVNPLSPSIQITKVPWDRWTRHAAPTLISTSLSAERTLFSAQTSSRLTSYTYQPSPILQTHSRVEYWASLTTGSACLSSSQRSFATFSRMPIKSSFSLAGDARRKTGGMNNYSQVAPPRPVFPSNIHPFSHFHYCITRFIAFIFSSSLNAYSSCRHRLTSSQGINYLCIIFL